MPTHIYGQVRIPYEFRQFTIRDGLPNNTVYTCFQDSKGYIWFCTASGATRFDGRTFQNFNILNGLADNEIISGTEDLQGRIWFHTINGRLSYFDTETEKITSYREWGNWQETNGSAYLTSIKQATDSSVWILVERYIMKRILPNGQVRNYNLMDQSKQVMGIFRDKNHGIYLAGDTFRRYDAQRDSFVDWVVFSNKSTKLGRFFESNDRLIIESDDGIFEFKNGVFTKIIDKRIFKKQYIRSITADAQGNLWIGVTNGFYTIDLNGKKKMTFQPAEAHVSHVFRDNEGNVWVCTLGKGVLFFPVGYDNITVISKLQGLESQEVNALAINPRGHIVMGTYPNTLNFWDKDKQEIYRRIRVKGLWDVRIQRIIFPNATDLWLQTDNYRLDYFPDFSKKPPPQYFQKNSPILESLELDVKLPEKWETYSSENKNKVYNISELLNTMTAFKNVHFAKNRRVYTVSSRINELTLVSKNRAKFKTYWGSNRTRYYCIAEGEDSTMWFGGTEGVCFLKKGSQNLTFLKENFETTVNNIIILRDDYLLCTTTGNGVFLVKDGKIIKNWTEEHGLSNNSCNRAIKFDEQTIFIGTAKGVTRLKFDPNDPTLMYPLIFGGKDLQSSLFVNDLLLDGDKLYIASNDGVYSFKINDLKIQRSVPLIRLVKPMPYLIQPDTFLRLRYGWFDQESEIKFNFRAIAYCNGEVMTYRYKLWRDGIIEKQDSMTTREEFTLPLAALNSGQYLLEVETSRGDHIWSKPIRARFEVPRAIYRTTVAIFIYWLIFAALTFEFFRWLNRRKSLKQQRVLQRAEERLALERKQLEWEQEAIRARIDPHFVFNALNGILTFVYKKDIESVKIQLPRLARFIRSSLNLGKEEFISIEKEAHYLNDYLLLEQKRFEGQFEYNIKIDETIDVQQKLLPPLLLQIFVENAVRHGISSLPDDRIGDIVIVFDKKASEIYCRVKDNGMGFRKLEQHTEYNEYQSMGINLAKRRIHILNQIYGEKYRLNIYDTSDGVEVVLVIKMV
ncbi:MAG: histidine kinase [Saprospiraceae bacterium]|nr:histidine kinase [Saprospiraceae bacterium]